MSGAGDKKLVHVALLPSAGMGHLTPFLRLAALLAENNVCVSFINPHPTVSQAESRALSHLLASFPQIMQKQFNLLPLEKQPTSSNDPFYHHFEVIHHSSHLLPALLSSISAPPLSAVVTDMSLASTVIPITHALNLANYIFFTSSAKMFMFFVTFHRIFHTEVQSGLDEMDAIRIPGLGLIPTSWIPPPALEKADNFFKTYMTESGKKTSQSSGILVNTFESLEQESLRNLNDGKVIEGLPAVIAIGPLAPCDFEKSQPLTWLDDQQAGSVMYVSFGSRTAMSRDQVRELGDGLVRSRKKFIWAVKGKKVDREDNEELDTIVGDKLMERLKENGLVVKQWLNQVDILSHPAIGGFLSHCGWNSVTEAIWNGVPILAWPQHGDQKLNADVVEKIGVGTWEKSWGWGGELVVNGADIARKIKEIMENEVLRVQAMHIRDEARKAISVGGTSKKELMDLIEMWKKV